MEKSLRIIQKIVKVLDVLCTIAFVFSIIGAVFCLIGILSLGAVSGIVIDGQQFTDFIFDKTSMSTTSMYATMVVAAFACGGTIAITKIFSLYFRREIKDGTPFTLDGAHQLFVAGICSVAIPVGISIVSAIVVGIISAIFRTKVDVNVDMDVSIVTGLVIMFISLLCKYGAQVQEASTNVNELSEVSVEEKENEKNN